MYQSFEGFRRAGMGVSVVAFFTALCCILPMVFILVGLGGAWMAVFGKIAALSPYAIGVSAVFVVTAWLVALRRKAAGTWGFLVSATVLTLAAWLIFANEAALNDRLIAWM